jgi:2-C-methyl-D-erythritol 2,4-cyclodiphosphate synthase
MRAAEIVKSGGWTLNNVDVVVIAERPKIGPHVDAMRVSLSKALGIDVSAISIKGKTNEGVGELGRAEAIAVHAVALLERNGG